MSKPQTATARGYRNGSQRRRITNGRARIHRSAASWESLSDEELLDVRICDLGLRLEGSQLEQRIERLYWELSYREIRFRPHFWLGEEWFSPDGVPGVAIPFYLAHPRLARLERQVMLEVEGGTKDWCMKILRHEAGHALDTAYRLHRRSGYRRQFGKASQPYPETYKPRPFSRNYVQHLDSWYAQSHPVEDFAETFAVWLKPQSNWRSKYCEWPALKKLEYVDDLLGEIYDSTPPIRSREFIDPIRTVKSTLREHYQRKRDHYLFNQPHCFDRQLRKLFSEQPKPGTTSAACFLGGVRPQLRREVADWTGEYQYTIDQVLREMIHRCRELNLRLDRPESVVKNETVMMLTAQTMNYLKQRHHRLAL